MSDTRYPTRMHEVLGVEPEEWFTYSEYGNKKFWLSESGLMYCICDDGTSIPATQGALVFFINNPERITRRPRLTEEQVTQLARVINGDMAPLPFSDHAVTYDGEWYGADTGVTGIPGLLEESE